MTRSEELFERAKKVIPGGVNSPGTRVWIDRRRAAHD